MNINTYLRRFGRYTPREKPFNEIDALILSELAYVNFQLVAPSIDESKAKPLRLKIRNICGDETVWEVR